MPAHRSGKDGVAHDRKIRRVIRKTGNHVGHAIFRMPRRISIRHGQAPHLNDFLRVHPLPGRSAGNVGMQSNVGKPGPHIADRRDVIAMRMRDEQVFQIESMLVRQSKDRPRLPPRIEQGCLLRILIPDEEAVHRHALLGRDHRQLPPAGHIDRFRLPAARHGLKLDRIQTKQSGDPIQIQPLRSIPILFKIRQLRDADPPRLGNSFLRSIRSKPRLEYDIPDVIFQAHAFRLTRAKGKANAKPHPALSEEAFRIIVSSVTRLFIAGFSLCLSLSQSPAAEKKAPAAPAKDKTEAEYQSILEADDKARGDIDKWILEEGELRKKGAGVEISTLDLRIEQRRRKVEESYRDFILRNPKHARVRLAFGSFLNEMGRQPEAAEQWEKAREIAPENPAVWNNLANFYGHKGPVTKAFDYYYKAIELAPFESVYHHNLAVTVYLFRKDAKEYFKTDEDGVFDRALDHYHKAMKLDPNNFELATDYAQSYYGIRPPRIDAGLKAWHDARKLARDDFEREGIDIHLARFEIHAGRFEAARKRLASIKDERYGQLVERVLKSLESKQHAARGISEENGAGGN